MIYKIQRLTVRLALFVSEVWRVPYKPRAWRRLGWRRCIKMASGPRQAWRFAGYALDYWEEEGWGIRPSGWVWRRAGFRLAVVAALIVLGVQAWR